MATLIQERSLRNGNGWHPGERAVHALLRVPTSSRANPTNPGLSPSYAYRVSLSPLLALGTLDAGGRPWTSVWGGERGFAAPIPGTGPAGMLGVRSLVDRTADPAALNLFGRAKVGEVVKPAEETEKKVLLGGLGIDLESRDRVKLAGELAVGVLTAQDAAADTGKDEENQKGGDKGDEKRVVVEAQLAFKVTESLGNCPKYLNKKTIWAHLPSPRLAWSSSSSQKKLPQEAVALIRKADMFFLSTTDGESMDTNHRGGPPGFVRVFQNTDEAGGIKLVYPEYSGNRLYQSLGNLQTNPQIGVAVPDFGTSDVLYLTGTTELLVGDAAEKVMPHAKLAVLITVTEARFVQDGLSFRAEEGERSPYNPPVRRLAVESTGSNAAAAATSKATGATATATLIKKEPLTPTISRFTFFVAPERGSGGLAVWKAGQHITLDFSAELDNGWSHMNDGDPQSLNDDFVRTFTVSSPPPASPQTDGTQVQITARRHGPVTDFLWRQNVQAQVEVPVLGFGGEERFSISSALKDNRRAVFIAGGVGITPLLAQAPSLLLDDDDDDDQRGRDLRVLWSLRREDVPLAVDVLTKISGLAERVKLFVTGKGNQEDEEDETLEKVRGLGASMEKRRLELRDVVEAKEGDDRAKFFLCAGPGMISVLEGWLDGEEVVSESFEY